jgi:hypothetical protein
MVTPKIKALFKFIEFLHSNIDNFKQYDNLIHELHLLDSERQKLRPRKNFQDKLKFDKIQAQCIDKFNVIRENIIIPIRTKATELNICEFQNEPDYSWNGVEAEIHQFKEDFSKDDLPEIFSYKNKYLKYRIETKGEKFFKLGFFFSELDEILKQLFDYFKETEQNEFEAFETKAIKVNDFGEAVKMLQLGHNKIVLPNSLLSPSNVQQQNYCEPLPPPQDNGINKKKPPQQKDIFDFLINIDEKESFLLELKDTFKDERGKSIKAIIEILKNSDILVIREREHKTFIKSLENYFNRNIGSYQSIQDVKVIHSEISNPIFSKLNPLILKYKQK